MADSIIRHVVLSSDIVMSREYCRLKSSLGWYGARFRDLAKELYCHPFFYLEHDPADEMNDYGKELLMGEISRELSEENYFAKALELRGNRKLMVSCLEELSLSLPGSFFGDLTLPSPEKGASLGEIYRLYRERCHPGYARMVDEVLAKVRAGEYDRILSGYRLTQLGDLPLSGREKALWEELSRRTDLLRVELAAETGYDRVTCQAAHSVRGNLNRLFQWMSDEGLEGKDCALVALDYDQVARELYFRCAGLPLYLHGGLLCRGFAFFDRHMTLLQEQYVRSGDNNQFIRTVRKSLGARQGDSMAESLEKLFTGKVLARLKDLEDFLGKYAPGPGGAPPDAFQLLREEVEPLRFAPGELGLERGGLELFSLDQAYGLPTENLAVLNLSHRNYPGSNRLDPVLKREERQSVNSSDGGCLSEESFRVENQVQILLGGCRGLRFLSYESHKEDTGKLEVPSSLFSDILKVRGEEIKVDNVYRLCGVSGDYLEDLTAQGSFLNRPSPGSVKQEDEVFGRHSEFKEEMSASSLETYYSCPYRFYLRYLERIKPPEWGEEDLSRWLDPMVRGSLLHRAYELLLLPFVGQDSPSHGAYGAFLRSLDDDRLDQVWNGALDSFEDRDETLRFRDYRPEVAPFLREKEMGEIRRNLGRFLEHESTREDSFYPVALEKSFDFTCTTGSRTLKFNGFIDRVETDGAGRYRVWDYKTGGNPFESARAYLFHVPGNDKPDKFYFQHALYSLALKELGEFPDMNSVAGGYYFCTDRGGWSRVVHSGGDGIGELQSILEGYGEQAGSGVYCRNGKSCSWCDYRPLCNGRERFASDLSLAQLDDLHMRVVDNGR